MRPRTLRVSEGAWKLPEEPPGTVKLQTMKVQLVVVGVLCALAYGGVHTSAHHALGAHYLEHEERIVEGVVVELVYRNPHAYVYVDAATHSGDRRVWAVECGAPGNMVARTDTAQGLKPGDYIVVTGLPGRDPAMRRLFMKNIVRPSDGRRWSGAGR